MGDICGADSIEVSEIHRQARSEPPHPCRFLYALANPATPGTGKCSAGARTPGAVPSTGNSIGRSYQGSRCETGAVAQL